MKKIVLICAATLALTTIGCKSEIDNKTAATVEEPTQTTAEAPPETTGAATQAEPTTAEFDNTNSKIEWVGAKVTGDHKGGFNDFAGEVTYDADGNITAVTTEVDTLTLFSDTEKLTKHLKSADFFSVEEFPKATFQSTSIKEGAEGGTHTVTGNLKMHGIEKKISFPVTIKKGPEQVVTTSEFTIKRFDWKVDYKGKADDLIKDEVLIKLNIVTPAPKAG